MFRTLELSTPLVQGNEWKYVKECLDTNWVSSSGKFVDLLEEKICEITTSNRAVACINGTAALQIALQVLGVQAHDEVIVPTVTFIAPVNAVRYLNAEPIFMDCDDFYNINIEKTTQFIEREAFYKNGFTYNKKTKRCIRAVILVHVFGNAVNLECFVDICRKRNIKIIEDASESLGTYYVEGLYKDKHTGIIGDVGCYSFNGNKIVTTGGGGMLVTQQEEYARLSKYLTTQAKDDPIYSIHNNVGYNFRLSNIQAALGLAQLEQLEQFLAIKTSNYEKYKAKIGTIEGLQLAPIPTYSRNNCWMYAIRIDKEQFGISRDELLKQLRNRGIEVRPLWYLNHMQKPYRNSQAYCIKYAHLLYDITLNIPSSVGLSDDDIEWVAEELKACKK